MAIQQNTHADGAIDVMLDTLEDWNEFASDNHDAIVEQYGSTNAALRHALDGGLELGGGAAPLVVVYFNDIA